MQFPSPNSWAAPKPTWSLFPRIVGVLVVLCAVLGGPGLGAASANEDASPVDVRLGVRVIPPFVQSQDERLTGFSIDLWREIERVADLKTVSTTTSPDVTTLVDSVANGRVDAAIAAISITAERQQRIDFSQPMFDSGLTIMTSSKADASGSATAAGGLLITQIFRAVFSRSFLELAILILLLTLVPAHAIYFIERRSEGGMLARTSYLHGLGDAYLWSITALASQADNSPRTRWGRGISVLWMYFSVIFIAFFTAGVTSNLTTAQLNGKISGPQDLKNVRVVTVAKTTAANYLQSMKIPAKGVANISQAYDEVESGRADAIVYDAPILHYYEVHDGRGRVKTVGRTFHEEGYGIAFPKGSPLRDRVNVALLRLREDGTYSRLMTTWFGAEQA